MNANIKHLNHLLQAFAIVACSLLLSGCFGIEPPTPDDGFNAQYIYGLWQENGTQHYVRYTHEKADNGYEFGREWDEEEDVYESDLVDYGNGWFKFVIKGDNLHEIMLMDNQGAEIPKVYTILKLTDTELSICEKEHPSFKFNFSKVVEAK